MEQPTIASLAYDNRKRQKKQKRKERFLEEMDRVIPWEELVAIVSKKYSKGKVGRKPYPVEAMLQIYFMQQWYCLSDPAMEDSLYDIESMRRFSGVSIEESIPDETWNS